MTKKKIHWISAYKERKDGTYKKEAACGVHNRTYAWTGTMSMGQMNELTFLKINCENCLNKLHPELRGK